MEVLSAEALLLEREVEGHALLIAARAFDLDDMLDGDAPVRWASTHARRWPEDDLLTTAAKAPA